MLSTFVSTAPIKPARALLTAAWAIVFSLSGLIGSSLQADEAPKAPEPITIFAAASLADVLPDLGNAWAQVEANPRIRVSLGASAVMARQIEVGAAADIFISANQQWIDHLLDRMDLNAQHTVVAENDLVLAVPCSWPRRAEIASSPDGLANLLASQRFSIADPEIAPAGAYSKAYLEANGIWELASRNAVYAGNVRLALLLIERGGLPGFVYKSDARKSKLACTVSTLEDTTLPKIQYIALFPTKKPNSRSANAARFLAWLRAPEATAIWKEHGFKPPVP